MPTPAADPPPLDGSYGPNGVNSRFPVQPGNYYLLNRLRRHLFTHARSVASCGRTVLGDVVSVASASGTRTARLSGVARCNNPHGHCPVCAARLAVIRQAQARQRMREARAAGHRIVAMTFTARPQGLPLAEELDAFDGAMAEFTRSLSGRAVVAGYVNQRDITLAGSGDWHPHRHLIVAVRADTNLEKLRDRLIVKWVACVGSQGGTATRAAQLVVEVEENDDDAVAAYCTSAAVKPGDDGSASKTIRDIVVAAAAGDGHAIWRLNEYAAAMRGRRAVSSGGVLRLAAEPAENEISEDNRVLDIEAPALRELDKRGLLDGLVSRVAGVADGGLKRLRAHVFMMEVAVDSLVWFVDWDGHEHLYYSVIDPGEPFVYDGQEWDEPEPDRLAAAIASIMSERPGISAKVGRMAAMAMAGVC